MSSNEYYDNQNPNWEKPPAGWEQPPPSYQGPGYQQGPPQAPYEQNAQQYNYPPQGANQSAPQHYGQRPQQYDQALYQYGQQPQQHDQPPQQYGQPSEGEDRGMISDTFNRITHHGQPHSGGPQHANHPSHPLAPIADPHLETISLTIRDAGNDHDNLIPTHGSGKAPAFTVHYNTGDFNGQVWRGPLLFPKALEQTIVGSWHTHKFRKEKLKFEFPPSKERDIKEKCEWGFNPDKEQWASDVGFLSDHDLSWSLINETKAEVSFTLKCTDVTDSEKRVCCQVVMTSYNDGRIEIPLRIVSNFEQLEEIVTVATAVMDRCRDELQ